MGARRATCECSIRKRHYRLLEAAAFREGRRAGDDMPIDAAFIVSRLRADMPSGRLQLRRCGNTGMMMGHSAIFISRRRASLAYRRDATMPRPIHRAAGRFYHISASPRPRHGKATTPPLLPHMPRLLLLRSADAAA